MDDMPASLSGAPQSAGIYVINLDQATERWQSISSALANSPWPVERVPALDGFGDPAGVLEFRNQRMIDPPHGIDWNPLRQRMFALVEEATFCSHMRAWSRFLQSDKRFAIVMEDDAHPESAFAETVRAILESGLEFDIAKMEGYRIGGSRLAVVEKDLGACRIVRSLRPASGTAAYLLSRAGAQRFLTRAGRLPVAIDEFLWNPGFHCGLVYHVAPFPFSQVGATSFAYTGKDARSAAESGAIRRLLSRK